MLLSKQNSFSLAGLINKCSCLESLWRSVVPWGWQTYTLAAIPNGADPYFSGELDTLALGLLGHSGHLSFLAFWDGFQHKIIPSPFHFYVERGNENEEHEHLIHFTSFVEHQGIGLFLSETDLNVKWVFKMMSKVTMIHI